MELKIDCSNLNSSINEKIEKKIINQISREIRDYVCSKNLRKDISEVVKEEISIQIKFSLQGLFQDETFKRNLFDSLINNTEINLDEIDNQISKIKDTTNKLVDTYNDLQENKRNNLFVYLKSISNMSNVNIKIKKVPKEIIDGEKYVINELEKEGLRVFKTNKILDYSFSDEKEIPFIIKLNHFLRTCDKKGMPDLLVIDYKKSIFWFIEVKKGQDGIKRDQFNWAKKYFRNYIEYYFLEEVGA
jgi:hypothetical protein